MKKIFIPAILVVAAVSGSIGFRGEFNTEHSLNDIVIANIEALTSTESGVNCLSGCKHIGWGWDKILECDCNYDHFSSCGSWGC